ncbi:tetratricopeptide repeat protein [Pseudobacteriovorax antillogorgiicola]|nr:tetratricopeptide repeat protein [Pseudobacteriovorax antillogorgiicola]
MKRFILLGFWLTCQLALGQRYSQIVIPFPNERAYDYHFNQRDNAIIIELKNTQPEDLDPLYNYDDRLIRRLIVKEMSGKDTQIKLVLRDQSIKAAIYAFKEPHRLVIDLYDNRFQEARDPKTGLPFVDNGPPTAGTSPYPSSAPEERLAREPPSRSRKQMFVRMKRDAQQEPAEDDSSSSGRKRRLLQPKPKDIQNPQQLVLALEKTNPGIGSAWKNYPVYMYRTQTSASRTGKNYRSWLQKNAGRAMDSGEAMADYASQLFDFGHELKALIAYQKVLHESPLVFDKDSKHLWNLAEIHFGQRNLTLADGYYQSVIDKHPDSPLAQFAAMRKLDVRALKAADRSQWDIFPKLYAQLDTIQTQALPELRSLVAIRKAYWGQDPAAIPSIVDDKHKLPTPDAVALNQLESTQSVAENPKTVFLISSILLNDKLRNLQWNQTTANFAGKYFKRFQGKATEPFRSNLLAQTKKNISHNILKSADTNESLRAINMLENLPKSLGSATDSRDLAWAIGESYRKIQQPQKAVPYYEQAKALSTDKIQEFQAQMYLIQVLKRSLDIEIAKNNTAKMNSLRKKLQGEDAKLAQTWDRLEGGDKLAMTVQFKEHLEANLSDSQSTKTHNKIHLWSWTKAITPSKQDIVDNDTWKSSYQANAEAIFTLSQLSKEFLQDGDTLNHRKAKSLLRNIDPGTLQDQKAEKLWAQELTELAEIHRENNEYLDAGRIYALTGNKSKNWEKRAEALYKGGLLLYRSGRREEALQAFEQAANDGNNLLYAELAKKRLEQLKE